MKCCKMILLLIAGLVIQATAGAEKPNIIFFLVDDLGYGDVGCFWQDRGSRSSKTFDTPTLDKMASEGVMLTHHYVAASVCSPSRASLISGRHQGHAGVRNNQFDAPLPLNHTIGSVLKEAGYYTAWIGKAGLSGKKNSVDLSGTGSQNLAANPLHQGFDRFFGYHFHGDGHEHYPRNGTTDKAARIFDDYQQVTNASLDLYTTDAWTAAAKKVIIDQATAGTPFFVYLAYDTPHFKMQRPAVAYPPLDNDGNPLTGGIQWTTATDAYGRVRYASTADGNGTVDGYTHPDIPGTWAESEKQHVGMIRRIDDSIADIMKTLKDLEIDDNTLLVFSSDNGPHNEGNDPRTFESFANLEGIKRDLLEGGIRVPTIVRWPSMVAGSGDEQQIHRIDYPCAIWDWMPTFAAAAGVPAPAGCDGVSLLPTLTGTGTQRDKGYLYFEYDAGGTTPSWPSYFPNHSGELRNQQQCIRMGRYMGIRKPVTSGTEDFRIYDVTADPGQGTDVAALLPDLQQQMKHQVIWARRPLASAPRPYDLLNLPAIRLPYKSQGVQWKSYAGPFPWVPEWRDMTPAAQGSSAAFDPAVHAGADHTGVLYEGYLLVPADGAYTFYLRTDDGGSFFLHDAHLIDDDFHHDGSEVFATVNLDAGLHPYRLYYKHGTGGHTLSLQWSGPHRPKEAVGQAHFFIAVPVDGDVTFDDRVDIYDLHEMAAAWVRLYDLNNYGGIARNWLFRYPAFFTSDPIVESSATVNAAYSSTIADTLYYHYDMPALTKYSGPAWLHVSPAGELSGTPAAADLGTNRFVVQADDDGVIVQGNLQIAVVDRSVLTWTGFGDGMSLFQEANWDLDGTGPPPSGTVDKHVAVLYDMRVAHETDTVGGGGATGNLVIGDGFTLKVTAGQVQFQPPYGITGVTGGDRSYMTVTGGVVRAQYFAGDLTVSLGGTGVIRLFEADDPLHATTVDLTSAGAGLHLTHETVDSFRDEHLGKITVNGAAATLNGNLSVTSDGASGCVVNAIF